MELLSSLKNAYKSVEEDLSRSLSPQKKEKAKIVENETELPLQPGEDTQKVEERPTAAEEWGNDWKIEDSEFPAKEKEKKAMSTSQQSKEIDNREKMQQKEKTDHPPPSESSPTKGRSQMESLAKEDLIKYIKKQAQLLLKSKSKCDELAKSFVQLREEKEKLKAKLEETNPEDVLEKFHTVTEVRNQLAEQLHSLTMEHEKLEKEHKTSLLDHENTKREKRNLEEELQSTKERFSALEKEKQDLACEVQNVKDGRSLGGDDVIDGGNENDKVEELKEMLKHCEEELAHEKQRNLEQVSEFLSSKERLLTEISDAEVQAKKIAGEKANALIGLEQAERKADTVADQLADAQQMVEKLQETVQEREKEMGMLKSENASLAAELGNAQDLEKSFKERACELEERKKEAEDLLKQAREEKEEVERNEKELKREIELVSEKAQSGERQLREAEQRMAKAVKEAKQSSLIDLELADYQRTIESLEGELASKQNELDKQKEENCQNEQRLTALKKEIELADKQRTQVEERAIKMKAVLVKTRKELSDVQKEREEQKKKQSELQTQVEIQIQSNEETKLETSKLMSENQAFQEQMLSTSESHQSVVELLEEKLSSTACELESVQKSYASCQAEFDAYKVRVHTVLKQQKEKSGSKAESLHEEMRRKYEEDVSQLREEIKRVDDRRSSVSLEKEELEEELEGLSSRHDKLILETNSREIQLKAKIEEMSAEMLHKEEEHAESVKGLAEENETQTKKFKDQLRAIQHDHRHTVEVLQQQVASLEEQLVSHQNQRSKGDDSLFDSKSVQPVWGLSSQQRKDRPRALVIGSESVFGEEREQAEGMEDQSQLESLALTTPGSAMSDQPGFSLERLLSSGEGKSLMETSREKLSQQLQSCFKRIDHLTEVLRDSEANSLRLSEQAKVLKEEIRRLERNQERERNVANLEYLKNVVLKFLHSHGSEQEHLVPILTTLLKLSPEEMQLVSSIVQKDDPQDGSQVKGGNWTNYLHKWTGF